MRITAPEASVGKFDRINWAMLIACVACLTGSSCHAAPPEELPLVRVTTKSGSLVGELQNEDEKTVQLFDFQSNRSVSLDKTSVTRIENPITLDDAARYVALAANMMQRIRQSIGIRPGT